MAGHELCNINDVRTAPYRLKARKPRVCGVETGARTQRCLNCSPLILVLVLHTTSLFAFSAAMGQICTRTVPEVINEKEKHVAERKAIGHSSSDAAGFYAHQLLDLGFGYALYEPGPVGCIPVRVGDVGYVLHGSFHRLFNIFTTDDAINVRGTPENFAPENRASV